MDSTLDPLDVFLRLLAAAGAGMVLGLDRDLKGKPTGMRTLGLVGLAAALVSVATVNLDIIHGNADAMSRVIQGIVPGVLTGIGFVGAGAVLRNPKEGVVEGLTTAATVWVTAAIGIACGLSQWPIVLMGVGLTLTLLVLGRPLEALLARLWSAPTTASAKGPRTGAAGPADDRPPD